MELYLGIGVFFLLFVGWVVVPSVIKKRHGVTESKKEN